MAPLFFIEHYTQLLRLYWRPLLAVVFLLPATVSIASIALLMASPKYTSVARVTMLPSEGELAFSSSFFGGTRKSQANVLSSTHKEYLKSWPVVQRALGSIPKKNDPQPVENFDGDFISKVIQQMREGRRLLVALFNFANSGGSEFEDPEAAAIKKYQDSIELESVEGTFILQIKVTLSDPNLAADFANALAAAYAERAFEQASDAATILKEKLAAEVRLRQAALEDLAEREFQLRKNLGALSLEDKRLSLKNALETERAVLTEDRVEKEQIEVRHAIFEKKMVSSLDRETKERFVAELDLIEARSRELDRRISVRSEIIENLNFELDLIAEKEKPLLEIGRKRQSLEGEIAEFRGPVASLELAGSGELSKLRIISPARPSSLPSSPKVLLNMLKGLIAGIFLSLSGLVAVDLLSNKIRTVTDLRRVVGNEILGFLPRRLTRAVIARRGAFNRSLRQSLEKLGASMELLFSVKGFFSSPSINVTGFGSRASISHVGLAIAAALASTGKKVSCRLPHSENDADFEHLAVAGSVSVVRDDAEVPTDSQVHIECLEPVSADFDWTAQGPYSRSLICAVPSGTLLEDTIRMFQEEAPRSGLATPLFLLVEAGPT